MKSSTLRYAAGAAISAVLALGGVGLANAQSNDTTIGTGTTSDTTSDTTTDTTSDGRGSGGGCDEDGEAAGTAEAPTVGDEQAPSTAAEDTADVADL